MGSQPLRQATGVRPRTLDRLQVLLGGYEATQLIYVIVELGIPDLLAEGPRTAEELARETDTHADSLRRVLRAVASLGVLSAEEDGRFGLNSVGERLREDVPGSLRALALSYGRRWRWEAWAHLTDSVRTGRTAFEHAHGKDIYGFLAEDSGAASDFNEHMAVLAEERGRALADAYDFSGVRKLVDVGGGQGSLVEALLLAYPDLEAVVYDAPAAVRQAQRRLWAAGLADRVSFESGNFFAFVPVGADAYVLSNVLHDWDDDDATAILRSCRAAIGESGRLLVLQDIAPPDGERSPVNVFDISLLVLTGGRERTLDQYRELLSAADFRLERVAGTAVGTSLLVAAPR